MGESVKRRLDEFGIEHGVIEVRFPFVYLNTLGPRF